MSDISINGRSYGFNTQGSLSVKKINSPDEIKNNQNDDIVIKTAKDELIDVSASKIDIKGSLLRPYFGLPKAGDNVLLFVDNEKVEGSVVLSDNENKIKTLSKKASDKVDTLLKDVKPSNTPELSQKLDTLASKADEKAISFIDDVESGKLANNIDKKLDSLSPSNTPKLSDKLDNLASKTKEKVLSFVDDAESGKLANKIEKKLDTLVTESSNIQDEAKKTLDKSEKLLLSMTSDKFIFGSVDTYKKGSLDLSLNVGKQSSINADYIFNVKKVDEYINDTEIFSNPRSTSMFIAQSVGASAATNNDFSVGYKATFALEVNRPFKNDFSVGLSVGSNAGVKDSNPYLGLTSGIEARYELNDKATLIGGFSGSAIILGENKGEGFDAVKLGLNYKF